MSIADNFNIIKDGLPSTVKLVAVSKFHPSEIVKEAYDAGQRVFGESRPQEFRAKALALPKDIEWHFIGHLQTNKIKMVVPYAALIQSVDSENLLMQIDGYCERNGLKTEILLEVFIAKEETKQGFSPSEVIDLFKRIESGEIKTPNITYRGLMAMASFVDDEGQIRIEFLKLTDCYNEIRSRNFGFLGRFDQLSFGMSSDYKIAIEMGSTMVRIGTAIFGSR